MRGGAGRPPPYRLIVAAVSEKREGLHTIEAAARLAAASHAKLVVYHAIDLPSIPLPPDSPLFREALAALRERALNILRAAEAIARSLGVDDVETVKLEGDPVEGLWEVVRRVGRPDLIVVGRPPRGVLGSRVTRILRGSPSSVLIASPQRP